MSVTDANLIQEASSVAASGALTVTLPTGTTAGNTVIVAVIGGASLPVTPPSGWAAIGTFQPGSAPRISLFTLSEVAAGQGVAGSTAWTFTPTAGAAAWIVREMSNLDNDPVDVTVSNSGSPVNGGTISTGTTALSAGLSDVALAFFGCSQGATAVHSWSGYTNGFTETTEQNSGNNAYSLAVAEKYFDGTTGSTFETTATYATTGTATVNVGVIVTFRAADAPVAFPLAQISSFKWGTHAGMANLSPNNPVGGGGTSGTYGTQYQIGSGFGRDGGYGLQVTDTGIVSLTGNLALPAVEVGVNVCAVSGSGVVVIGRIGTTASELKLVYNHSTNQFGLQWGTGTVAYEPGTTAVNTFKWVSIRAKVTSTLWHAEWSLEEVAQTSPADVTGTFDPLSSTFSNVNAGTSVAQTAVSRISDYVFSRYYAAGPLSQHWTYLLVPDSTGATVSGTSANFQRFTANGTLANVNGTEGALLDEIPPTISASADGVVQVTTATSDYLNLPMGTYTCAADEIIAGVRFVGVPWGGTGAGTGTLGIRGYDGTTETILIAASTSYDAGSPTAGDATNPLWLQAMWPNVWNQTKLNNAAVRMGYSTDATPDMGLNVAYLEVAIKKASTVRQVTVEDPISATVDLVMNPYSSASVSYVVTNSDAARSVNFNYSVLGTPQSPVTVSPSSSQTVTVNADNYGDVNVDGLEPQ